MAGVKGDYSEAKAAVKKNYDKGAAGKYAADKSKFTAGDWFHTLGDVNGRMESYAKKTEYVTPGSVKRGKAQAMSEAKQKARLSALQTAAREKGAKKPAKLDLR